MKELRTVLPYVRPYRRGIAAGLVLVLISNAFQVATPELIGRAIDALARPGVAYQKILIYAGLVILAALLSGAAKYGMRELLNGLSRRVETDLRHGFFRHLLRLDATFYGRNRTGDLMSRATNDIKAVRQAVGPAVMYTVNTIALSTFALILMIRISAELTAIALIPMVLMPPGVVIFGRIIHERFQDIQDHFGVISTMVQENLSGARIVRAYVQEDTQQHEFEGLNQGYLERNMALARREGLFRPLLTLLAGLGVVVLLWFGGRRVIDGAISIGDFVAFSLYLNMLTWPMIALGFVINQYQRGAASMGRINDIMETEPSVDEPVEPVRLEEIRGEIEFRDVSFRYPDSERAVLSDVSFRVPAGATAAIVGPTGAGKSTLVSLLARLYDPTSGTVLVDGVPIRRLPLEQLRGALGFVPQDAFLFSETIGENIALALPPGADADARIREAAATARLDEAIASFPRGFETRLGERGINLSGGQKQRTTLARALARDPRILVLDDALSAVDTKTEAEILERLEREVARRTALIISHRVGAVKDADLILVLDDGRIVERGTHAELLAAEGLYARLLRRQLLEEGLEEEEPVAKTAVEV